MTKLAITIHYGSKIREHHLELATPAIPLERDHGKFHLILDGAPTDLDWAEIAPHVFSILVGGRSYEAAVTRGADDPAMREGPRVVTVGTRQYLVEIRNPRLRRPGGLISPAQGPQEILAPMPGKIAKLLVSENDDVSPGAGLLVIEAMKMQNELRAPRAGRVEKIYVAEGAAVDTGSRLVRLG